MRRIFGFLPSTRRQWAGSIIFLVMAVIGTYQAVLFDYNQRLKAIEEREWKFWSAVSRDANTALIVVNCEDGRITGWNPAATELLGWKPTEVLNNTFLFLVPEEYIQEKYGSLDKYFNRVTGKSAYYEAMGTVKVINGYVNTKPGKRIKARISVRTIGGGRYFYIVAIDAANAVEEIAPDINIKIHPDKKPMQPVPNSIPMTGIP
jgi:PAS domain S-box-containing protein